MSIFEKRNGEKIIRKIYKFLHENYRKAPNLPLPNGIQVRVNKCKVFPNSCKKTWSAKLYQGGQLVSNCDAIMVGKSMAEINIGTEEAYRRKGYGTIAARALIDKLLEDKITPCWSAWPFRKESQHLALKLGFEHQVDVNAWIWMESMQNKKC